MSTSPQPQRPRRPLRRVISTVATTALLASGLAVGGSLAVAQAAPASSGHLNSAPSPLSFTAGRYIVTLADEAASTYTGGVSGLAATKPAAGAQLNSRLDTVKDYARYLLDRQHEVAAAVGAKLDYSYNLSLNGFSAQLSGKQAASLARDKRVVSVIPDELKHVTAVPSTDFLGLSGPDGVWAATGGVDSAGAGIVLGVLDTGIAPENPSFAGGPLGTTAGAAPYYSAPGETSYLKADGGTFTSDCETGEQFTVADCSTKIIGARYFLNGFGADRIADAAGGEYVSPRDGDGHGSHTGSTAVGNADVAANVAGQDFGNITGVAPAAKIAAYKVCWTGDPDREIADGCTTSDIIAAIDAAVSDGVDVINFSIGGTSASSTVSPTDQAFFGAAAAGIFVAASAGNAGPGASTLDNASPWITTVAASTIPTWEATVELGDGTGFAGSTSTVDRSEGAEPVSGPFVTATSVAVAGAETPNLCIDGSLDPALAEGKIIACERGVNDRVAKSAEVDRVGGIGMVLINPTPNSLDLDTHSVPTVHLDARFHDAVLAYAATAGATATLVPGNTTDYQAPTPQVAAFSSRGPVLADGSNLLKPDITAPGVGILAATANPEGGEPTWQFESGTSMSSPHIAGLAVLYLGEFPTAPPAAIKSAMMTTAYDTVDGDGNTVTDPFVQGAGHVDPTRFFSPGLVYLNGVDDWLSYIVGVGIDVGDPSVQPIDASNLNLASIAVGALAGTTTVSREVTSTQAGTFTAAVDLPGFDTVVSPSTLTFAAPGEAQAFTVQLTRTDAPLGEYAAGNLTWRSGSTTVRSPIVAQPVAIVAPEEISGEGVTGSVQFAVTPGSNDAVPVSTNGLVAGTLQADPTGEQTEHSGAGVSDDQFEYLVTVPEGASYARFDLDAVDDSADFDLTVIQLDADGNPVIGYQSATGSADERVNIESPEAGDYQVFVDVYTAATETAFDLTTWALASAGEPLTVTPPAVPGGQGVEQALTASWSGLAPATRFLGQLQYADTGVSTFLTVVTGGAEPAVPVATTTSLTLNRSVIIRSQRSTATVTVTPQEAGVAATGTVQLLVNGKVKAEKAVTAENGKVRITVPALGRGVYQISAKFVPDSDAFTGSRTGTKRLVVVKF